MARSKIFILEDFSMCTRISPEVFFSATLMACTISCSSWEVKKSSILDILLLIKIEFHIYWFFSASFSIKIWFPFKVKHTSQYGIREFFHMVVKGLNRFVITGSGSLDGVFSTG